MSSEQKNLYQFGGMAFIASGGFFLLKSLLDLMADAPPSTGVGILAWVASNKLVLALTSEVLFFAVLALVPAVIALYQSLA